MQVIVTLAGKSSRFKAKGYSGPKFLLDVAGASMLERVLDMFSWDDDFFFVASKSQVQADSSLLRFLFAIRPNSHVTVVQDHSKGPAFSALQAEGLDSNAPVIVSYCDFFVVWNYETFKRVSADYDAAAPSFKGFHPASFGNTLYAYMKLSPENTLLELREKACFTADRRNEHASTGIYYFRSASLLKHYAKELVDSQQAEHSECYVSLILNLMVRDNLSIHVSEVSKFVCLGTPEDYEEFLYWGKATQLNQTRAAESKGPSHRRVNLIPMAGSGSRFKAQMFRTPKPFIEVDGELMAVKSADSMPPADLWVLAAQAAHSVRYGIEEKFRNHLGENVQVVEVPGETQGQLHTCLLARGEFLDNDEILIASADYLTVIDHEAWDEIRKDPTVDVAIWTSRLSPNQTRSPSAFAYCRPKHSSNEVVEIVEKQVISEQPEDDPLVTGTFWFRSADTFFKMAERAMRQGVTVKGELYIGNAINLLISQGMKVVQFPIETWVSFGDPHELDLYLYWKSLFSEVEVFGRSH